MEEEEEEDEKQKRIITEASSSLSCLLRPQESTSTTALSPLHVASSPPSGAHFRFFRRTPKLTAAPNFQHSHPSRLSSSPRSSLPRSGPLLQPTMAPDIPSTPPDPAQDPSAQQHGRMAFPGLTNVPHGDQGGSQAGGCLCRQIAWPFRPDRIDPSGCCSSELLSREAIGSSHDRGSTSSFCRLGMRRFLRSRGFLERDKNENDAGDDPSAAAGGFAGGGRSGRGDVVNGGRVVWRESVRFARARRQARLSGCTRWPAWRGVREPVGGRGCRTFVGTDLRAKVKTVDAKIHTPGLSTAAFSRSGPPVPPRHFQLLALPSHPLYTPPSPIFDIARPLSRYLCCSSAASPHPFPLRSQTPLPRPQPLLQRPRGHDSIRCRCPL
ncbi:uncharacterized protein A4U43_UnF4490 [Asparagus officinalis]|uniref:Uncharacterized protein n=1 Tax=Asparagus officinalis TaxID=4686 RepID=A0A1R3L6V1_ASPOF|nr:uncharacterized protein A4U43_UnF4490 [Asparagus officinalis]